MSYALTSRITDATRPWAGIAISSNGLKLAACDSTNGYIWTSSNYGVTWVSQTNSGARGWNTITCNSGGTILLAGVYNQYLYISTDSGLNWTARLTDANRLWYGTVSSSNGTILAACNLTSYIYIYLRIQE